MDPLRKRFFVNGEPVAGSVLHAQYLKPANALLAEVKRRMQLGGLQQLTQCYTTEDGATLTAMSRFGQDEIRIDVPQSSLRHGEESIARSLELEEEFQCVWGANVERYLRVTMAQLERQNPLMDGARSRIYVRQGLGPPSDQSVFVFDAKTLAHVDTIRLDGIGNYVSPIGVDTKNNRFVQMAAGRYTTWQSGLGASSVAFANTSGTNHRLGPIRGPYAAFNGVASDFVSGIVNTETGERVFSYSTGAGSGDGYYYSGMDYTARGGAFLWFLRSRGASSGEGRLQVVPGFPGAATQTAAPDLAIPFPYNGGRAAVFSQNNGKTLWAYYVVINNTEGDDSWRCFVARCTDGQWEQISIAGLTDYIGTTQTFPILPLLAHDPITDAVVVGLLDGSGVWVFNSRDCADIPNPPFFVPVKGNPAGFNEFVSTTSWGISQVHNGTMLAWFAIPNPVEVAILRLDIGRLNQTRIKVR